MREKLDRRVHIGAGSMDPTRMTCEAQDHMQIPVMANGSQIRWQKGFQEEQVVLPDKVDGLLERRSDLAWHDLDIDVGMRKLTIPFDLYR